MSTAENQRKIGRISEWNDPRGYGFVTPENGGERAFVHIKAFRHGARRPSVGDRVIYTPGKDAKGRPQALQVTYPERISRRPEQTFTFPRAAIGLSVLALSSIAAYNGLFSEALTWMLGFFSLITLLLYGYDKAAARGGQRRTPEVHLHLASLFGGWPGALIAQQWFRHKTIKQPFQTIFWLSVAGNLILLFLLDHYLLA